MNEGSCEESLDSIPRPEYEAFKGGNSAISTPTNEVLAVPAVVKSANGAGQQLEGTAYDECLAEENEEDEDEEPYTEGEEESTADEHISKYAKPSYAAAQQVQPPGAGSSNTNSIVHDTTKLVVAEKPIMPVQIIAAPKILPAKTKDNKLLLVQLISETGKPIAATPLPTSSTAENKMAELTPPQKVLNDEAVGAQQQVSLMRSSTPLSREFVALQKSVNESKILSEFVTDGATVKARKLRKSGGGPLPKDGSAERTPGKRQVQAEDGDSRRLLMGNDSLGPPPSPYATSSTEKRRKFVPLRDEHSCLDSDMKPRRRSRSKSVNRKSPVAHLENSGSKLKKWPSDEKILKRTNMRSQNSEFVQKQLDFLSRVMQQQRDDGDASDVEFYGHPMSEGVYDENSNGHEGSINEGSASLLCSYGNVSQAHTSALALDFSASASDGGGGADISSDVGGLEAHIRNIWQPPPKRGWDSFCWKCRECGELIPCSKCVRCFHTTCIKVNASTKLDSTWICPECTVIENVLSSPRRTRRSDFSLELLGQLLAFALKRMRNVKGHAKSFFAKQGLSCYSKYIVNPVTFNSLQEKLDKKVFRCAEEFVNETKWVLHNALILSNGTPNSKEALTAKGILKICRQEANEIDTCAECYLNANTRSDWFVDVCAQPHLLVWAKLKGFPYWPAKAMGPGQGSLVNVRFFGEHDRAFVPVKDCFLYSEQDPNTQTGKRSARELADCIKEVEVHIAQIRAKIGDFKYACYKTPYEPADELQQLELMMPGVTEYMNRQQTVQASKPPLQYKIVKTADNNLSIIKKATGAESSNDSDHSASPSKKLEATSDSGSKTKVSSSKYEVVCKAASDDSNSSKLGTVILKRKSVSNEHKKSEEPEQLLSLPKMTKIEESPDNGQKIAGAANAVVAKRRHGGEPSLEGEKHKSKHAKHANAGESRVPMLTIKTNGAKIVSEQKEAAGKEIEDEDKTQSLMENLVKNKQGVTIKKISKERKKSGTVAASTSLNASANLNSSSSTTTSAVSDVSAAPAAATTTAAVTAVTSGDHKKPGDNLSAGVPADKKELDEQKSNEKASNSQSPPKVAYILKDLVPFVEIKKEAPSDDEAPEREQPHSKALNESQMSVLASTVGGGTKFPPAPIVTSLPQPLAQQPQDPLAADETMLTSVKQEVVSEDDDTNLQAATLLKESAVQPTEKPAAGVSAHTADAVRVVGDTTIQRLSAKNTNIPAQTGGGSSSSAFGGPGLGKRASLRGVPFGPLPAAASVNNTPTRAAHTPTSSPSAGSGAKNALHATTHAEQQQQLLLQQQQQSRQSQRARKSFPNRSPTEVSPTRASSSTTPAGAAAAAPPPPPLSLSSSAALGASGNATCSFNEAKRSLLKTSMVAIPVDMACRSNNPIPVPPLTAVSKTMLPATTAASTALPVSTVITSVSAATTAVGAFSNCNGNPATTLLMTTPPPLAGLSQTTTSVSGTLSACSSGSSSSNATAVTTIPSASNAAVPPVAASISASSGASNSASSVGINGLPTAAPNAAATVEAHLLGDFVTPALASAITEVICRGPPKMIARPNGPLQSDGSTMFPSQDGPVCRTLVENAHKLTDFFISVMQDTMCEMSVGEEAVLQAKITLLTMDLERTKQAYEHEIAELKRTSDLMLCEMRKSMEHEKTRLANDIRKQCELERLRSVEETKRKQWCANCGREAQFYCCWNTSYCDYPCQQLHWSRHAASCAQTRPSIEATSTTNPTTTGGSSSNLNQPQDQRPYTNVKTSNVLTTTTSTQYSKTVISSKKDKHGSKGGSGGGGTTITTISNNSTQPAEVLKLPSNTYLRPVTATSSSGSNNSHSASSNMRTSTYTMPMQVQRFNIPLPITAAVNTAPPFTIVQRGSSWELMSAAGGSTAAGGAAAQGLNAGSSMSGVSAPLGPVPTGVQQQQQQQQQQTRVTLNSKSGSARNRLTHNAPAGMSMNSTSCVGGGLRSTQM